MSDKLLNFAIIGGLGILGVGVIGAIIIAQPNRQGVPTPSATTNEIQQLRDEITALKNQKPQIIIKEVAPKSPATKSLTSIISEWRPRVARLICSWKYADRDQIYLTQGGSGIALTNPFGVKNVLLGPKILTNRHVITDTEGYMPTSCEIKLPDDNATIYAINDFVDFQRGFHLPADTFDWGVVPIAYPDSYVANSVDALTTDKFCTAKPSIGDSVVILGYPGIGSQTDITATEGIISGFDGNYFITSAKVEHGNSGGVAILVKNDCYLGIPSFVDVGSVESLARILDINVIFNF